MKTTTIRLAALATMLTAASFGAHAAETADLAVTGTIRPSACNVSLSGNGTVDFGTISALTLSETSATTLAERNLTLTITCDAATRVSLVSADNRASTANVSAGNAIANGFGTGNFVFGVGTVAGHNIGAYGIGINRGTATADGSSVDTLRSYDHGATWGGFNDTDQSWVVSGGRRAHSWAASGTTSPSAYSTIVQPLFVRLAIGPTSELPALTSAIPIDGLATLSLIYL